MKNHIVIFGWDYFVKSVVEQLVIVKQKVIIVTNRREHEDILTDFPDGNKPGLLICSFHDHKRLEKAHINDSRIVLVNLQDDTKNLVFVLKLKQRYPTVRVIVPINNTELSDTFVKAGITYALSRAEICAKLFASHLFEKHVASYLEDILTSGSDSPHDYDMQQYLVVADNPIVGSTYQDVFVRLKTDFNVVLIGISKDRADGTRVLYKNPYEKLVVETGDYLILITDGASKDQISNYFGVAEGGSFSLINNSL